MDRGVIQVRLRHSHSSFFLLYLRAGLMLLRQRRRNLSCPALGVRLGHIERLLADYTLFAQAQISFIIRFGLGIAGPGLGCIRNGNGQIGLGVFQVGIRLRERTLEQWGINLGNQLPLFNVGIEVNIEPGDRARYLRSDLHCDYGIDCACGFHYLLYFARFHPRRVVLDWSLPSQVKGGEDSHPGHEQENNQDFPLCQFHFEFVTMRDCLLNDINSGFDRSRFSG
jgi:hypothetical protein